MNCAKCGEVCGCVGESIPNEAVLAEVAGRADAEVQNRPPNPDAWRDELAQRLTRYRTRRKAPPPRYPSLKLPFQGIQYTSRSAAVEETAPLPAFEAPVRQVPATDAREPVSPAETERQIPRVIPVPVQQVSAKIIEFPRFAWAPPPAPPDQLAEPVGEQLRILEVPEIQPPPPALGGITIEAVQTEAVEKRLGIDIPLQIAPWERRLAASLIDSLIIGFACGLFGLIFWKIAAVRPPQIQLLGLAAGTLAIFWAAYQYLLIVYSGSTPGLRAAGLELTRFDGNSTSRSLRRWRIFASYLSALSLGMGYVWAFLDEDSLCWHDRISRTHFGMKKISKS